jgi:hypothetical protein
MAMSIVANIKMGSLKDTASISGSTEIPTRESLKTVLGMEKEYGDHPIKSTTTLTKENT